jgi:hypothetical protein
MNQPAKTKAAAKTERKAAKKKKPAEPARERNGDSDDVERAVYDGMQDLRTPKPK